MLKEPPPHAIQKYIQSGGYERELIDRAISDPVFQELIKSGFAIAVTSYITGRVLDVARHIDDMMISFSYKTKYMPSLLLARKLSTVNSLHGHTAHSVYMDAKKILDNHQITYTTNVSDESLLRGCLELIRIDF